MDLWSPTGSDQLLHDSSSPNPPPDIHNKWKTLMPWKLTFLDTRIAKTCQKIFHIIKPMELKDKLQSWFYNDTCAAVLGESAHWPEGWWEMLYSFPHRPQSDPQILAKRATENWKSHFSLYPYLFWYKKENFVLLSLCYYSAPPHLHTLHAFIYRTQ